MWRGPAVLGRVIPLRESICVLIGVRSSPSSESDSTTRSAHFLNRRCGDSATVRMTFLPSGKVVLGVRFFALPSASGLGMTRHPQKGAV